jgi:hypothetical protein
VSFIDFILNLAGLLLWLNWRSMNFDPLFKRTPATLMGTLRPAAPKKLQRWHFLVFITALLFVRAVVYWWIGPRFWTAKLDLNAVIVSFHSRTGWFSGCRSMCAFSFFSFALGIFYLCLLPLSLLEGPEQIHRLVKIPLGRRGRLAALGKDHPAAYRHGDLLVAGDLGSRLAADLAAAGRGGTVRGIAHHRHVQLSGLEISVGRDFAAAPFEQLHLLRQIIRFWKYVNVTAQKIMHR